MLTWLSIMLAGVFYAGPAFTRRWFNVSCLYYWLAADWRDNTCRPTAGKTHFNVGSLFISPAQHQTKHDSCFLVRKEHLPPSPVISPGISLTSFIQSHALAPASQESGGPSFGQH